MIDTVFKHSTGAHREKLNSAKREIVDGMHPIAAVEFVFDTPACEFDLDMYNGKFRQFNNTSDAIIDCFVFPDPATLMAWCLHLGVHPADLIPKEMHNSPSPRSIVQACQYMAEDHRFPAQDRERADDFCDAEMDLCLSYTNTDYALMQLVARIDLVSQDESIATAPMWWGNNSKRPTTNRAKDSKAQLIKIFGEHARLDDDKHITYPAMPTVEHYIQAMEDDRELLRQYWRQRQQATSMLNDKHAALYKTANRIFGAAHAVTAVENTVQMIEKIGLNNPIPEHFFSFFMGQQESSVKKSSKELGFKSEEDMCAHWLHACQSYLILIERDSKLAVIVEHSVIEFKERYRPDLTNTYAFETAFAAYANYKILSTKGCKPPYMNRFLAIYGIGTNDRILLDSPQP